MSSLTTDHDFDDADLFDTVLDKHPERFAYDPNVAVARSRKHEREKRKVHEYWENEKHKAKKLLDQCTNDRVELTRVQLQRDQFENAYTSESLVWCKGIWMKKHKKYSTRSVWFPSAKVPQLAHFMQKFDLDRALSFEETAIWELGKPPGSLGVCFVKYFDWKRFDPKDKPLMEQCVGWPKKLREEFESAVKHAVALMPKIAEKERKNRLALFMENAQEEADEAARAKYIEACVANLPEEDKATCSRLADQMQGIVDDTSEAMQEETPFGKCIRDLLRDNQ
jgi:hypothetical protein